MYQDFTKQNSSYLTDDQTPQSTPIENGANNAPEETLPHTDAPIQSENPDSVPESGDTALPPIDSGDASTTPHDDVEATPTQEESAVNEIQTDVPTQDSSPEPEPVPEPEQTVSEVEEVAFVRVAQGLLSFFHRVTEALPFATVSTTTPIETAPVSLESVAESEGIGSEIESSVSDQAIMPEVPTVSTDETTSFDATSTEPIDGVSQNPETEVEVTSTTTEGEISVTDAPESTKPEVLEYPITLSDFSLPELASGQFITNVQLRVSFAAQNTVTATGTLPVVDIEYKLRDGWQNAGSIIIDDEVSNALNGGYFLFALPQISNVRALTDLEIRFMYRGSPDDINGMYLDSAWLEIDTETFDRSLLRDRIRFHMQGFLKSPRFHNLIGDQLDFTRSELPTFSLRYNSQRNVVVRFLRSIFSPDLARIESVTFKHEYLGEIPLKPTINMTPDGLWTIQLTEEDKRHLRPGRYEVDLAVSEGSTLFNDSFEFQWGLLSINPLQSTYTLGDIAEMHMAALAPTGDTLCRADLRLYIIDPDGFMEQTEVNESGVCDGNSVVDVPDYSATYALRGPGEYEMYLEHVGKDGEVVAHTSDTFLVVPNQAHALERSGPTRIYPPAPYTMELTVHALLESFTGTLTERVPNGFVLTDTDAVINEYSDYMELSWDMSLLAGTSESVSYTFDAPDISPYLYELGPAELTNVVETVETVASTTASTTTEMSVTSTQSVFKEHRKWQIASDVPPDSPPYLAQTPSFDNILATTTTPTLGGFAATDPDGDLIEYEFSIDDDYFFGSPATTSLSVANFGAGGWESATFASGATTTYTIQPSDALTDGVTYWWRVRARDPFGDNTFTTYTQPRSVTIDTSESIPGWEQTLGLQFERGTLSHSATTTGGVTGSTTGNVLYSIEVLTGTTGTGATTPVTLTGGTALNKMFHFCSFSFDVADNLHDQVFKATALTATNTLTIYSGEAGSGNQSLTYNCQVVSFTPSSNINVQRFLTPTPTSDTANNQAITAVSATTSTFIIPHGETDPTDTTIGSEEIWEYQLTSLTNVAIFLDSGNNSAHPGVRYEVVDWNNSDIRVQHINNNTMTTAETTDTIDITQVNLAKTWLIGSMTTSGIGAGSSPTDDFGMRVDFLDNDTIRLRKANTGVQIEWSTQVIEDRSVGGIWNVQSGSIALGTAETSDTFTLSSAVDTTSTFVNGTTFNTFGFTGQSNDVTTGNIDTATVVVDLTASTTITATRGVTDTTTLDIPVQAIEFISPKKIMSPEIDFDWVPNQDDWGDVSWSVTEPSGSDTLLRVYYSNSAACDTRIPDGDLAGNSAGFDVADTGLPIANLSTSTYNRICLQMIFDQGSATTSPTLNDWAVSWVLPNQTPDIPVLAEVPSFDDFLSTTTPALGNFGTSDFEGDSLEYEFTLDNDFDFSSPILTRQSSNYPGDAGWSAATFSSGATTTYTIQPADALTDGITYWWRVRARDPSGSNTWSDYSEVWSLTIDATVEKPEWHQTLGLQFERGTLSGVATTTGGVEFVGGGNNTPTVKTTTSAGFGANTPGNDPTLTVPASAVEGDYMVVIFMTDDNAPAQTITPPATETWTLQESGSMPIDGTAAASPAAAWIYTKFVSADDEANAGTKTYTWQDSVGTEEQSALLILLDNVAGWGDFNTNLVTGNQTNVNAPNATTTEANEIVFHAAFKDNSVVFTGVPSGTEVINNGWGPASDAGAGLSVVYEVYGSPGATGVKNYTLTSNEANGFTFSLTPTSVTTGTIMSPEIDFDWVLNETDWGDVSWDVIEPVGTDSFLSVYYSSSTACDTIIPDSALPGNSTGFDATDTGLNIVTLATSTYNRICLEMTLTGSTTTSPTLNDWTVSWILPNQAPETPALAETPAFENMHASTTQPGIGGFATQFDYEGDSIEYEFSIDDDYNFGSPATTTSSSNYPNDAGWNAATFAVNATTTYAIQSSDALTNGVTYWWRVRARDPLGSNEWSDYSEIRSITINSSLVVDEWYQTTEEQFAQSIFANTATSGDAVGLSTTRNTVSFLNAWSTGNTKAVSAGSNRLLVVGIYSEDSGTNVNVNTVTYGGSLLTEISDQQIGSGFSNGMWMGYLTDAGIASSSGTTITPTWIGGTPDEAVLYASAVFENVDQSNPVPDFSAGTSINDSAIQIANPIQVETGDMVAYVTVTGAQGETHTADTGDGYTEGTEQDSGGIGLVASDATKPITADGTEQPTATWSGTPNRVAIVGATIRAAGATGTVMSREIDHDWVPNRDSWGEVSFSSTEPANSDVRVRVYYTSATACDTIVPNGALTGNSAGFLISDSPVNISGLATSTYNRICLQAELDAGSTTTSPTLDDWTVSWTLTPLFTQNYFKWYANENAEPPTDPWPAGGGSDFAENEVMTGTDPIDQGEVMRLRMSLLVSNTAASTGDDAFKLQSAVGDTCSPSLSWQDVGPIGSSTPGWRGYNNAGVSDGATLSSTTLSVSDVFATYEEENNSAVTPNGASVGEDVEWDWVVENNTATPGAHHCFRMVKTSGAVLTDYLNYPVAYTNNDPDVVVDKLFDNEQVASTTPWFEFYSTDDELESIHFQVQIDNDADFGSTIIDTNTEVNLVDFQNLVTPADKAPYNDSETIRYIPSTTFTNGVTYWWRVRAKDPDGSNVYGDWTTSRSFTIDTTTTFSTWFQTTEEQFETDTLVGTEATASDQVDLLTGSTTGSITSSYIDFDWVTSGNIWGELRFTDTETSSDLLYQIEYFTSTSSWALIPDSDLSGNSVGFDTTVALQGLDTDTYNQIRIVGNLTDSGASPILHDWTVEWGSRVETPSQSKLFPNERVGTTTPTFEFTTIDLQGDSLTYQIQWSTAYDFSASTTRTSDDLSIGFINADNGGDTDPFISGDTIQYTIQPGDALTDNTTYWWRVRAKDTTGDDLYSLWTDPRSFTVATTTVVSTWFQTTEEQFDTNVLSGIDSLVSDQMTVATSADEALIVYGEATNQTPRYRTWDGSSWSDEDSTLSIDAALRWAVLKESPTQEEYVLGTLGSDGDVNVQVYRVGAWGNKQEITATAANVNARGVGVAYESNSGDAVAVACDGDADPTYYVWNGTTWTLGGTINVASTNNCEWIDMASDPTSDEIIVLTRDTGADYEAQVWNGSSWGNAVVLGDMNEVTHGGLTLAYEDSGDQAVIVTSNDVNANLAWNSWNGTSWSGNATFAIGDDFEWGYLAPDDGSDNMALCYIDQDIDIGVVRWTGAGWVATVELDIDGNGNADRPVSCQFETTTGRDGFIMTPYSDTSNARYQFWNGATWSGESTISTITDSATVQAQRTGDGTILALFYDDVNDRYDFSRWNGASWSTAETLESDATKPSSPFLEPFMMAARGPAVFGTVTVSPTINFTDGVGPFWDKVSWVDTTPGSSDVLYQVQYFTSTSSWAFIQDSQIPGNSVGTSTSPIDLSGLNKNTYGKIRLFATLTCQDVTTCPSVQDWTVEWAAGITVSGTAREYDQVSSTTAGSVAVAVNGSLQIGKTGSIQADGTWSIANVTTFPGDVVTVFVAGAADSDEAIGISRYDGIGNMSGMELHKRHLSLGSNDATTTPLTNAEIGLYDFTNDEDLFFDVNAGNDLDMCATTGCADSELRVLSGITYQPGSGADIVTHDFENNGTFRPNGNTIRISGSWDNNATATMATSTVIFTATTTTESIDSTGAVSFAFYNVTLGETSGTATWNLPSLLDVNNNFSVAFGTLARATTAISIANNLSTGANGFWSGIGTTTFDGTGSSNWTDQNAAKQNIGNTVVNGTSKTILLGSNVTAESITIGADDILDVSISHYDITLYQNWINNNTFVARNGEVFFAATTTNKFITTNGNAFYDLTFNGSGGSWAFTGALLTVTNDFTIATGTVTMPTGTTTISGSFSSVGGTFAHNNAVMYLTSSGVETISASGTPFTNAFYDLRFTGTGNWTFLDSSATTSNDFRITQGTVIVPSNTLTIGGTFLNTGGTFNHNSGTLKFTSAATEFIDTNASFNNLLFSGSGDWAFVDSSVTALGDVTIESGVVTFPTATLTVGGSLQNSASIAHNNGTILFNSTDTGETIDTGVSSLYNLTFNSATGGWTINEHATTSNNTTLTAASSFTLATGRTLSVGNVFTNSVGGASTTWTGSTLSLENGAYSINTKTTQGDAYDALRIQANTDIKMWNSSSTVYVVDPTGSLYSQDHSGIDGDLYIFGDYPRTSGTEYWSYATDFDGTSLGTTSPRQAKVYFADGASATIANSTFTVIGTTTASTTVQNQGSGTYTISVTAGTTTMNYYDVNDLAATGLSLLGAGIVTSLSDGSFTPAVDSGTALTVSSTTIDANPGKQIFRVDFSTTTAIDADNVTQTDGAPVSYWWFRNSSGNIDGEANDNDTGDPGSIRWDDSSLQIVISGVVYGTDETTPLGAPTCDGSANNVRVVVDGGLYASSTPCSAADGSYTFSSVSYNGDPDIVVYLDTNGALNGSAVTKTATADITDMDLMVNRVIVRHEDTEPMSITDMTAFDFDNDPDIQFTASTGSPDTLVVFPDTELHIWATSTFTPGGTVTLNSGGTGMSYDGSLHIDNASTFTGAGTTTYSIGGVFTQDVGATFIPASSTVFMTATTSGKAITPASGESISFNGLQFTGVGGSWNINGDITAGADIHVATGTVTGTGNITLTNGSFYGNGLVSLGAGETTIERANTLGGTQSWTFNDLTLGNGAVNGTTTPASTATTTVSGVLTIETGHSLDAGNSAWDLAGTGSVFVENGTFLEDTSTVRYSNNTSANILSTTYYNLDLNASAGTPTYTATGLGIIALNDLIVGGDATTIATFTTNDPALDVNGDVLIRSNGTLIGSNSAQFTVGGSWDNDGIYTGSGGTVTFDSSGVATIAAGGSSFSSAVINGTGDFTLTESATATNAFTLTAANDFTLQSGNTLAVGGTFTNSVGGVDTIWGGSTLSLYGGSNYQINASTTNDVYEALLIGANTDIRMWNSDASTLTVDSTGSLYSQDHASVNGDLYVYGDYVKTTGTDYWNYARDFDGTQLGGSSRKVDVYIANGARALYSGGGLQVLGDPSASTTIQNQGAGTYSLRVGGTASTSMSYYEVRDTDASGLVFSGTPNVVTLSRGDFLVTTPGGTAMTVGGTVINANPAKNFNQNIFATTTVIFANNVTATGTSVSSWRFVNHTGNISGEDFDVDPDGDPGYIVWDDSANNISISGNVYSNEISTVSGVCDDVTGNIHLRVAGLVSATTTCNSGTGAYTFTNVPFASTTDSLVVFIEGEAEKAAVVTADLISNISNMDLYENRVIVRHENTDPLTIADMAVWDSSDNSDIPFTAVTGSPDTLTLPADTKLIVWDNKEFAPNGNVTLSGGGAGAAYDGTLELYSNAQFTAAGTESHAIGGSFISAAGAVFSDANSTITFTTSGTSRTIDTNNDPFYNIVFNGTGSWNITNATLDVSNDFTITQGSTTLPSGTTTITGTFDNTGGTFNANGGQIIFNSSAAENVRQGGSDFGTTTFSGSGSWTYLGTHATTTDNFTILSGVVVAPSGILSVGGNFVIDPAAAFSHNGGVLMLTSDTASTSLTLTTEDLFGLTINGSSTFIMTDGSVAVLDNLTIAQGSLTFATVTLSIGGSFDNKGSFSHSSGTVLFNSGSAGKTVDVGGYDLNNAQFAGSGGGWTILSNATTTGNFSLTNATSFTQQSGTTLTVGGVFTNLVGGAATTWTGTILKINSGTGYTINTKAAGGDLYATLEIGQNTDVRAWNSSAATTTVDATSSFYSQDHSGSDGELYIYGDYTRTTGTDYWSYATDFDGTALGGGSRVVNVRFANNATTTLTSGTLQIIGTSAATSTITNQGSGTYAIDIFGGTLNALNYAFRNLNDIGLHLAGTTTVTSLSNGDFELAVDTGSLITVSSTTVNQNASKVITGVRFATTTAITGTNVELVGSTPAAWTFTSHRGNLDGEAYDIDGGDDCGSIRWDDSTCLLTQQSAYRWRNDDGGEGVPDSEWFDLDWSKRKRITVSNADASTYTDAAVKVTVTYDSDMQADFDDLRFSSDDGVTTLSYFIESFTASTDAVAWVKIPTLPASSDTTIYMYYGNGGAVDGSVGTSTFTVLDDFEDDDISEYSGDTGIFNVGTSYNYERTYGLDAAGNETAKATNGIYRTDLLVSQGETIRYLQYVNTGSGDETCTFFGYSTSTVGNNYAVCLEQVGIHRVSLARDVDFNDTSGIVIASSTATYVTGWHEVEIAWGTDNVIEVTVVRNGSVIATTSATDSTYTIGGIGFTFWFQNGGWDIYSSRPLLNSEPSVAFGFEQVSGGASWIAGLNTLASGVQIGTVVRPRFLIENTGVAVNHAYELEFAPKDTAPSCESVSGASYSVVPPQSSCSGSDICMQASPNVTNHASTTDVLGGSGTFTYGQIVENPDNDTQTLTVDAGEYTEVEYAIELTNDVTDSNYCLRVTDSGTDLDSYTRVAEIALVFAPNITALSLNNGFDITLLQGVTTTVYATGTVSDLNGYADLNIATATIFRSGVGETCTADNNNCYISTAPLCAFNNCSGNTCDVSCSADIYYFAEPTDGGAYAGETWRALLSVSDLGNSVATATAPSIDLLTLRAISVDSVINYGSLAVNDDTGSYNATTTIENIGNDNIDIAVDGTDLSDGGSSLIPVTEQIFATSTFTYSSCVICSQLSTTTLNYEVDLQKPTSTAPAVTDEVYWGISIPFGVSGAPHQGNNTFYAIGD